MGVCIMEGIGAVRAIKSVHMLKIFKTETKELVIG